MRTHVPGVSSRRGGFTLMELILSSSVMVMVLTGAYICLQAGFASQDMIEARADVAQKGRVAMNILAADLRSAYPLTEDFEFLGMSRMLGDVEADNLDFATHNYRPARPREADFCEISYFLGKSADGDGLSLWRRRDPTPDPEPLGGGMEEEIAEGLEGLRFEYYDGYEWFDEWGETDGYREERNSIGLAGNLYGMPDAVRITLLFESRDPGAPGKTRRGETRRSGSREDRPPPVAFQTVVYLNLADNYWSSTYSTGGGI